MMLTANCVTCQTQDDVAMLGFADDEFNTTQYVMLQKGLKPSQQDREQGFDQPHIEVNSQIHSGYCGVVEAQLQENRLVLKLDPQAAADMSVDDTIEIAFHVPTERLKEMGDQLRLLLGPQRVHTTLDE
jgi:hypothetical protein